MNEEAYVHDGEAWVWSAGRRHETGATFVPAGTASGWWAHPLTPHAVIAWMCDEEDGFEVFAPVFGAAWAAHATTVDVRPPDSDESDLGFAPPEVSDAYARLVVVRSLAQWYPEPIDELSLRIDEALAWERAGDLKRAGSALSIGLTSLASIATLMWADPYGTSSSPLPAYCDGIVDQAAALAERLLPDDDDTAVLRELLTRRISLPRADSWAIADDVARWLSGLTALVAGGLDGPIVEILPISPATVTPRILQWRGPRDPGLTAEREGDVVTVRVTLGPGCEPDDREARDLAGFACDAETGQIVSRIMLDPAGGGRQLVGQLRVPTGRETAVGVVEVARLDALRTDPLGRLLARLDRVAIARWAALRKRVLAAALGDEVADSITVGEAAEWVLDECESAIRALLGQVLNEEISALSVEDVRRFDAAARAALAPSPVGPGLFDATLAEALIVLPDLEVPEPFFDDVELELAVLSWTAALGPVGVGTVTVRGVPDVAPSDDVETEIRDEAVFQGLLGRARVERDRWPRLRVAANDAAGEVTVTLTIPGKIAPDVAEVRVSLTGPWGTAQTLLDLTPRDVGDVRFAGTLEIDADVRLDQTTITVSVRRGEH